MASEVAPSQQISYKGVYPVPKSKKNPWQALKWVNGRMKYIGSFATREEAAAAFNAYVLELEAVEETSASGEGTGNAGSSSRRRRTSSGLTGKSTRAEESVTPGPDWCHERSSLKILEECEREWNKAAAEHACETSEREPSPTPSEIERGEEILADVEYQEEDILMAEEFLAAGYVIPRPLWEACKEWRAKHNTQGFLGLPQKCTASGRSGKVATTQTECEPSPSPAKSKGERGCKKKMRKAERELMAKKGKADEGATGTIRHLSGEGSQATPPKPANTVTVASQKNKDRKGKQKAISLSVEQDQGSQQELAEPPPQLHTSQVQPASAELQQGSFRSKDLPAISCTAEPSRSITRLDEKSSLLMEIFGPNPLRRALLGESEDVSSTNNASGDTVGNIVLAPNQKGPEERNETPECEEHSPDQQDTDEDDWPRCGRRNWSMHPDGMEAKFSSYLDPRRGFYSEEDLRKGWNRGAVDFVKKTYGTDNYDRVCDELEHIALS